MAIALNFHSYNGFGDEGIKNFYGTDSVETKQIEQALPFEQDGTNTPNPLEKTEKGAAVSIDLEAVLDGDPKKIIRRLLNKASPTPVKRVAACSAAGSGIGLLGFILGPVGFATTPLGAYIGAKIGKKTGIEQVDGLDELGYNRNKYRVGFVHSYEGGLYSAGVKIKSSAIKDSNDWLNCLKDKNFYKCLGKILRYEWTRLANNVSTKLGRQTKDNPQPYEKPEQEEYIRIFCVKQMDKNKYCVQYASGDISKVEDFKQDQYVPTSVYQRDARKLKSALASATRWPRFKSWVKDGLSDFWYDLKFKIKNACLDAKLRDLQSY